MFESWSLLKGKATPRGTADNTSRSAPEAESVRRLTRLSGGGPLDALGQQSESVRERVNRMAERLDDARSLSADFELIIGPLNEFVEQHAASRARLMEVEALLAREREVGVGTRAELSALQVTSAKITDDLQDSLAILSDREERIGRQDMQITELRIRASDLKDHADSLDARLSAETSRATVLTDENAALRQEVAAVEDARAATERSLSETRERLSFAEMEVLRLRALAETLSLKISSLNRTVSDLEPRLQVANSAAALMQGKLAVEQSARQKSEAAWDTERAAHEMELGSLSMKIDGLNAHVVNTEKLIEHLREQLHEKSEGLRIAEKGLRDASAEKLSLERQVGSAMEASNRAGTQLQDAQRLNVDHATRLDMLAKAMAAKDQALDAANRKSATLLERFESINARFSVERSELEATHRRLIEELQNERAERSLAHGALEIARKSRSSLLAQYTALKRRTGGSDDRLNEEGKELESNAARSSDSNVMAFAPPEQGQ